MGRGTKADVPGVRVVALEPRIGLYTDDGRRSHRQALVFGAGCLAHFARHGGDYDVVHTASFPYFSLLAAAAVRPLRRFGLVVDWHEVWTRDYWREYLGRAGDVGWLVQRLCARTRQRAFCFSRLHAGRLRAEGLRGDVTVLEGEYAGPLEPRPRPRAARAPGRVRRAPHPREARARARARAGPGARAAARPAAPRSSATAPSARRCRRAVAAAGLGDAVDVPGFVAAERVDSALAEGEMMVLPSRREGYGMVVVEAAARGTPSVVVADPDNAATELVDEGVNGVVAASVAPEDLADAMVRVHEGGAVLRKSTADWFARNAQRLSMAASLDRVSAEYVSADRRRARSRGARRT